MIVNGKPIGYLYMYCVDHDQWVENRDIDILLADFDLEQETWADFRDEIDIAAEFGQELAENPELSDLTSDELGERAISEFSSSSSFAETLEAAYENEDEEFHDHVKAATDLCFEALVNSLFYEIKRRED